MNGSRTRSFLLILTLVSIPWLGGCATLGIATTEEMTQMQTDYQAQNRQNETRIQALEEVGGSLTATVWNTMLRIEEYPQGVLSV